MKIRMTNESAYVHRAYASMGQFQWAREFLKNSLEAGATRVEFAIEWEAVQKLGVYRRTVVDNGCGMTRQELLDYFGKMGESGKTLGGVHDNFGLGAKLSALPWNPDGVVVISRKAGQTSMIRMRLDRSSGDYELAEEEVDGTSVAVIEPEEVDWPEDEVDWSKVMPDWASPSGTAVVFLGDKTRGNQDTILGDPQHHEDDIKGLSVYLNTRFWEVGDGVEVRVHELRSNKKAQWPTGPEDKSAERRPNPREIKGACFYVEHGTASTKEAGQLDSKGVVKVADDRVKIEWYLWQGERPMVHSYAQRNGYIAVRYCGELFHLTTHGATFRAFGIVPKEVQTRLTLVIEPPLYRESNGRWGIHPDDSRQSLRFTDGGAKSVQLPMLDWAHEFIENLPEPLLDAVRAASSKAQGSLDTDKYRETLIQKYGDRWKRKLLIARDTGTGPTGDAGDEVSVGRGDRGDGGGGGRGGGSGNGPLPGGTTGRKQRMLRRKADGTKTGAERLQVGFVPRFEWIDDEVGDEPWHMVSWARHDQSGTPTVYLSSKSTLYRDLVKNFQQDYPPVHADKVRETVELVLGQIIVCKVAHACTLSTQGVSEETIDNSILTPANLTVALMGFMAEEAVIAQRLGPLGKKRETAATA